mmetsp:Transcript_122363/g.351601  ORF Transcript_122363/g.351601 Transcript_122363/m.351601 type:complete len:300 (-) Transcript_122363:156-1055(-)
MAVVAGAAWLQQVLARRRPEHQPEDEPQQVQDAREQRHHPNQGRDADHEADEHVRQVAEERGVQKLHKADHAGDPESAEEHGAARGVGNLIAGTAVAGPASIQRECELAKGGEGDEEIANVPVHGLAAEDLLVPPTLELEARLENEDGTTTTLKHEPEVVVGAVVDGQPHGRDVHDHAEDHRHVQGDLVLVLASAHHLQCGAAGVRPFRRLLHDLINCHDRQCMDHLRKVVVVLGRHFMQDVAAGRRQQSDEGLEGDALVGEPRAVVLGDVRVGAGLVQHAHDVDNPRLCDRAARETKA